MSSFIARHRGLAFVAASMALGARAVACVGDSTTEPTDSGTPDSTVKDATTNDVVTPNDATMDVFVDAGPACMLDAAFSTPIELASLNPLPDAAMGAARGAHLSVDFLTAYYENGALLYSASRPTPTGDTFTNITLMSSLEQPVLDAGISSAFPTVSSNGLTVYFSSNRTGIEQIYFATRNNKTAAFGAAAPVTGLPAGLAVMNPFLQGDGSTLYYQLLIADAGSLYRIYRSTVIGDGNLGTATLVPELTSMTCCNDGPAVVTADGLTVYFGRVSAGDGGPGAHYKTWTASRATSTDAFTNLHAVTEIAGSDNANDDITWVSNDGCQVALSSFRGAGTNMFIAGK